MNVSLSIKDDSELRNYIKDMIRGQVKSITREEIKEIIKGTFIDKINNEQISIERMIRNEIRNTVEYELTNTRSKSESLIGKYTRECINEKVAEMMAKGHLI